MKKRVWLDIETGKFSNSWEAVNSSEDVLDFIDSSEHKKTWKLIEYECLTDEDFQFLNYMRIA